MFKSARFKLTLWYFLTISFILLLFSALIYRAGSALLFENLSRLHLRLRSIELNANSPARMPKNMRDLGTEPFNLNSEEFLQDLGEAEHTLFLSLLFIDLGILSVSTFLAYLLAGRTLAPIEKSLKAQKRFTADAAHELRTPLTAIKTALEVNLADKKLTKTAAVSILQDNLKDIENLEKLSSELLQLSKVDHHLAMLNYQSIALDELLSELTSKFASLAKVKKIKIIGKANHDLIKTDYDKLLQILSIFLDNAIKYTPENGKINLSFVVEKRKTAFHVQDSGVGIKKEDLPMIFHRFYKIESSRNQKQTAGFGLGLAIASEIADLLNGDLSVTSQLGKGSTFTLRL